MSSTSQQSQSSQPVRDIDFIFENAPVRVLINRNQPVIELAGLHVGPFDEGKEYDVPYWIANELERSGIARLRDEELLDMKNEVSVTNRSSPSMPEPSLVEISVSSPNCVGS